MRYAEICYSEKTEKGRKMDESNAHDAGASWQETGTSAQAAEIIDRTVSELQREGAIQLATRLRLAANIGTTELLKVKLPGGRLVGISLDYILQEQTSRGVVDLTGERSLLVDWGYKGSGMGEG